MRSSEPGARACDPSQMPRMRLAGGAVGQITVNVPIGRLSYRTKNGRYMLVLPRVACVLALKPKIEVGVGVGIGAGERPEARLMGLAVLGFW